MFVYVYGNVQGHSFMVNGNRKNMNGTLLLVSADNLASHFIGGYKALSAALRKCRYCLATNPDMSTKVSSVLISLYNSIFTWIFVS